MEEGGVVRAALLPLHLALLIAQLLVLLLFLWVLIWHAVLLLLQLLLLLRLALPLPRADRNTPQQSTSRPVALAIPAVMTWLLHVVVIEVAELGVGALTAGAGKVCRRLTNQLPSSGQDSVTVHGADSSDGCHLGA